MEKFKGQQRLTVMILTFLGFAIAAFALSKWLPLSCLLIFLTGVAVMASASLMLVAGSADCHRRHARASHERVQPGLSCRYSSG